jgi:hypothetical protein
MRNLEKAQANRAYVRRLLRDKQPEFAIALEYVAREWCPSCRGAMTDMPYECLHPDSALRRFVAIPAEV